MAFNRIVPINQNDECHDTECLELGTKIALNKGSEQQHKYFSLVPHCAILIRVYEKEERGI